MKPFLSPSNNKCQKHKTVAVTDTYYSASYDTNVFADDLPILLPASDKYVKCGFAEVSIIKQST